MPAEDKTTAPDATSAADEPKKNNTSARAVFAATFAWVGIKLGWIGTAVDGANLLKGEPSKIRALGKLKHKLEEQVKNEISSGANRTVAYARTFKYSLITTAVGGAAGAALGWVRGNRVDDIKEVFHHPIKALKQVFGHEEKEQVVVRSDSPVSMDTAPAEQTAQSKAPAWTERTSVSQDNAVAR